MAKKKCGCKRKRGGASKMGAASRMGAASTMGAGYKRRRVKKGGFNVRKAARGFARGVTKAYRNRGQIGQAASFVGKNYKKVVPAIKKAASKSKRAIKAAKQEYEALKQVLPKKR